MNTATKSFAIGPRQMNITVAKGDAVEVLKTFTNGNVQVRSHGRYTATVPAAWIA